VLNNLLTLDRPLIVFDLETTGKDPGEARAVSMHMHVFKPSGDVTEYKTLINPRVPIPEEASKVHGITDEIIETGCAKCWQRAEVHPTSTCPEFKRVPTFDILAPRLYEGFRDADFGGYNIRSYDLRVMQAEFKRHAALEFDFSKARIIDGLRLWQVVEPRTLSDFVRRFAKRELEGAHDASVDVIGTLDGLVGLLQEASQVPRTPEGIHDLCYPRDPNGIDTEGKFVFISGVPCLNFGKHKGVPLHAGAAQGFMEWMLGRDFSPEVKEIARRALAGDFPRKSE
jgi:DNA polymerase-3 subunit epsilon